MLRLPWRTVLHRAKLVIISGSLLCGRRCLSAVFALAGAGQEHVATGEFDSCAAPCWATTSLDPLAFRGT
eukprot:958432-Pleurochrysis_carterae.AAC.3